MQRKKQLILVFGGTGQTGYHIANKLIAQGYPVRLAVRSKQKASQLFRQRQIAFQNIIQFNSNDSNSLKATFQPSIHYGPVLKVISALGASGKKPKVQEIQYLTQIKIVDLCLEFKINQYIYISAALIQRPWNIICVMINTLVPDVYHWKVKAENYIRKSGLKYTIIRPPGLVGSFNDTNITGYDIGQGDKIMGHITRATLGQITYHVLMSQTLKDKVTFEVIENKNNKCVEGNFGTLQSDTQANVVNPNHKLATRTYKWGFLLVLSGLIAWIWIAYTRTNEL